MKKLSTLLSLAITILATGCVPGNQVPAPVPIEYQPITLAELADEAPNSPKWPQFFEERGAAACWWKLQQNDKTQLRFNFQTDLNQAGVANEVAAGIVRYLAHYHPSQVTLLAIDQYLAYGLDEDENKKLTSLDPAIGQLTNLTELDLSANRLETLPAEITNLTNLRHLSIVNSRLATLPTEITNLTNLMSLTLSRNQLTCLSEKLLPWWQQINDPVAPENPWLKQGLGEPIALDALAAEASSSRSQAWSKLPNFLLKYAKKGDEWCALQLLGEDAQKKISQWRGGQGIVFFGEEDYPLFGLPFYLDRQLFTDEDVQAMRDDLTGKQLYRFWSLRR